MAIHEVKQLTKAIKTSYLKRGIVPKCYLCNYKFKINDSYHRAGGSKFYCETCYNRMLIDLPE